MLKTIQKRMTAVIATVLMITMPMAIPAAVYATDPPAPAPAPGPNLQNDLGCGATFTTDPSTQCANNTTAGAGKVQSVVTTIVDYFSIIVGLLAVIMLIYGGLKYITSGGDSSKAASARSAIVYAVIGLVIVALAQVIVQFVLSKANPNNNSNGSNNGTTTGLVVPREIDHIIG